MFDHHGNAIIPKQEALVVTGRGEALAILQKRNRVDRFQVLIVLDGPLPGPQVKLIDFHTGAAAQERVLTIE